MATTSKRKVPELPERAHRYGCVGERIETFTGNRPASARTGARAQTMTVVRCMDCGGQVVYDEEGNREWS